MSPVSPRIGRRGLIVGGAAAALLGACGRGRAPTDSQGRVRLRLALDAPAGLAQAGVFQALASDGFEKQRLTVEMLGGDGGLGERLAASAAELALASDGLTALDLAAQRAPVRAVAAFFQKSPLAFFARGAGGLTPGGDLRDRPILIDPEDARLLWPWLRARYGLSEDQRQPASVEGFFDAPRAVLVGDLLTTPEAVLQTRPAIRLAADDGYPPYGGALLVPTAFARDNARALRGFIAAVVEGWRDYLQGDPAEAHALMRRAAPQLTERAQLAARDRLKTFALVDGGDAALFGLGAMTNERWVMTSEAAVQAGLFAAAPPARDLFTDAYLPGRG